MADWYVDPNASGNNDGTSWANAYTSLQAAETAKNADITGLDPVTFHCKSKTGSADVPCLILGWTTDSDSWIMVQGGYAAGETGTPGTPENPTQYSTSYYHVEGTDQANGLIYISEDYVRTDKILFQVTETDIATTYGVQINGITATNNDLRLSNLIIKGVCSGTGNASGIGSQDTDAILKIWNCVIYDFISGEDTGFAGIYIQAATCEIYNCTIHNCYYGIRRLSSTLTIKNCAVFGCTDDLSYAAATVDYCATDDDDDRGTNGVDLNDDWADEFTDHVSDFSLKAGSALIGEGVDDPGGAWQDDTDIAGNARSSPWDIGAFEYVAAGGKASKNTRSFPLGERAGMGFSMGG